MTIDEIVDQIQMELTMNNLLPTILPLSEIRRLIEFEALPWFYENYIYAVIQSYYFLPQRTLKCETFTQYKYIVLPEEIQTITWLYEMNDPRLFNLGFGVGAGQGAVNVGLLQQPLINSYLSTIGELGVYKVTIDNFADVLNGLSKSTLKFDYNFGAKRLHILTSVCHDVILETYARIPAEDVFELNKFRRYISALSKLQLGRLLTRYKFPLPGDVEIDGESIKTEGQEELEKVKEEIKGIPNAAFFIMNKR